MSNSTQAFGTFITAYRISTGLMGAPTLTLHLVVDAPRKHINGMAEITQPVNPPLDERTPVSGDFTYMTVMPKNTHILVVLNSPILVRDTSILTARIVLEENWKSGTAVFTYLGADGKPNTITNAKVECISPVTEPIAQEVATA